MLSAQYINDLTTRYNPKRRQETFDSIIEAIKERLPEEQHKRLDLLTDQVEASVEKLLDSTYQVTRHESREKLEAAIAGMQNKMDGLLAQEPVDNPAVDEFKASLDEFQVALEVLNTQKGRKSLSKFPDKGVSAARAPKLWVLRHLLQGGQVDQARYFIKAQRVSETVESMLGILEFGGYDQPELVETARKRLSQLRDQS